MPGAHSWVMDLWKQELELSTQALFMRWTLGTLLKFDVNGGTIYMFVLACACMLRGSGFTSYIEYFVNTCNIEARSKKLKLQF